MQNWENMVDVAMCHMYTEMVLINIKAAGLIP